MTTAVKRKKIANQKTMGRSLSRGMNKTRIKAATLDFGTYHHSTPKESNEIRDHAEKAFTKLLRRLYSSDAPIRILDAGCGLGFLVHVAAKCFPKAQVTGVDLFKHNSLAKMSIEKAEQNMKLLGMEARTSFLKHDLTKPLPLDANYDLLVSNLVFHNLGKKRFHAYGHVFNALKPGGYLVIGDVSRNANGDLEYLRECSTLVSELEAGESGGWFYTVRVFRKS